MKVFYINNNISIVCQSQSTRNGFKHIANLIINEVDVLETKICYINRTWESFEYESIIDKIKDMATKEGLVNFKEIETENQI